MTAIKGTYIRYTAETGADRHLTHNSANLALVRGLVGGDYTTVEGLGVHNTVTGYIDFYTSEAEIPSAELVVNDHGGEDEDDEDAEEIAILDDREEEDEALTASD